MLSKSDIAQVERACRTIGNDLCDSLGFVTLESLLSRFNASLVLRPLLVEGMVAAIDSATTAGRDGSRWLVMVDSESYPSISEGDVASERFGRPLPARFRNTVAHELAHTLAYKPTDFGLQLDIVRKSQSDHGALVKAIEMETERLSPMLLWPDKAVERLGSEGSERLTLDELISVSCHYGVSRHVIINRLADLSRSASELLRVKRFANCAIALAKWNEQGGEALRKWPIFANFHRNLVPQFLVKLQKQDALPISAVVPEDAFVREGLGLVSRELVCAAGTAQSPSATQMPFTISIERASRSDRGEFFVLVRGYP